MTDESIVTALSRSQALGCVRDPQTGQSLVIVGFAEMSDAQEFHGSLARTVVEIQKSKQQVSEVPKHQPPLTLVY